MLAQSVVFPLDVLRRRLQLGIGTTRGNSSGTEGRLQAMHNAVRVGGGVRGLYTGLSPTFMKVAPAVALSVTVRDAVLGRLNK